MAIIHSSDLGWKAGQDISDEFAALAETFKPGDTFVFDHMYKISGSGISLPDNFTLAGGAPGAGIDIIDTATNQSPLFFLGEANTVVDLTVTHSKTPNTGYEGLSPKPGVDFHHAQGKFVVEGGGVSVLNSSFEGNVTIFIDVREADNLLIEDSEFDGGFIQVRFLGDVKNPTVHNSLFQNSLGDGIKTVVASGARHTSNATISESVFLNNNRDGIDTTGGFRDSVVTDSYFVRNWSGIDIKDIYDSSDDFAFGGPTNQNILIKNSEFIDQYKNAVIVTTLDRTSNQVLNENNATKWVAQNIRLENSVVENTDSGSTDRVFLVKSGYDVHWSGVKLLGKVSLSKTSNTGFYAPEDVNGTGVTKGSARPSQSDSYYKNMAGPDWSDVTYPTDGTTAPTDPVVDPDPISYTPSVAPAPVVEAPELVSPQDTNAGILLDIFVAYPDTDETISEIGSGSSIDSNLTDGSLLTKYAMFKGNGAEIGSVKYTLDGISKVENNEPGALFSGKGIENFLGGKPFAEKTCAAEPVVCKGENGSGGVLEAVTVSKDQSTVKLEDSAWKSPDLDGKITEGTILIFDCKSGAEGEVQDIGFAKESGKGGALKKVLFQLDGSQQRGTQDYSDTDGADSGFKSYAILVGEYYIGPTDQIVLVNDAAADLDAMNIFSNIYLIDAIL